MPPHTNFPLRWESTGDQWWFASPIDWAAANGHYDLVRELLHIDANLLIKLTSLRRIRRLETVWDDERFKGVANCRSQVAQKLLQECETKKGYNSLIRAGYGGWLLYTAASAGDLMFVKQMLDRDPLLVFGQGEYGITDVFYAAARSKSREVFRLLLDCALSPKGQQPVEEPSSIFKHEMMNRAVHAAVRGGNIDVLRLLLEDCSDVLAYRDGQGSTLLHTASGRGQVEVVEYLISCYDTIVCTVDNRGNTALHVAAYHARLAVIEVLASSSPSITAITNKYDDTFLHMAVAGFNTPSFKRLDRQMELVKQLVAGKIIKIDGIINAANNQGRTVLHMAVMSNIQSDLVELIMSARGIDINIRDAGGNTPLDLLKKRPRSASSEVLIKRLVQAGGVSNCRDKTVQNAFATHIIGFSPGTSFRIPDADLILHAGLDNTCRASGNFTSTECSYSSEIDVIESSAESTHNRPSPINSATRRLKVLLRWPRKEKNEETTDSEDNWSIKSYRVCSTSTNSPLSLREQFSRPSSTPTNKRILSLQGNLPSPSIKKKFGANLRQSVRQVLPKSNLGSPLSAYSESSWSSPMSADIRQGRNVEYCSGSAGPSSSNQSPNLENRERKHGSLNLKLINKLFSSGRSRPSS